MTRVTVYRGPEPSGSATAEATTTTVSRRSTDSRVAGGLLLTFGTGWLLRQVGLDLSWEAIIAGVLLALGVAMMVTPRGGQGAKLWFLGLALTLGLASMSSVSGHFPGGGISQTTYRPTSIADVKTHYEQLGGELRLDLSQVDFSHDDRAVSVDMAGGQIIVTVPQQGVAVGIEGRVTAGDVWAFGKQVSAGVFQSVDWREPGFNDGSSHKLLLTVNMTAGEVIVIHPGEPLPHHQQDFGG